MDYSSLQQVDVTVEATAEEHNITVDNPSTTSKEEEKVEPGLRSFVATYVEYLSDGLQVPKDGLDSILIYKIYTALLWKYGEAKPQKSYASDIKDPRRSKTNYIAPDKEQLVHIE
ncbi:hypothetical protein BC332_04123 [Capsicum chinense]|nr:hypothetical protein BC332_04123 [Capsicum chinense]